MKQPSVFFGYYILNVFHQAACVNLINYVYQKFYKFNNIKKKSYLPWKHETYLKKYYLPQCIITKNEKNKKNTGPVFNLT